MAGQWYERVTCLRCGRVVCVRHGRYAIHRSEHAKLGRCRMSGQLIPVTGMTDHDHERRAHLVADLAWQVQDEDPRHVWAYLTALPAAEVQRLLVFALAAIPVDRRVEDLFGWVANLPSARAGRSA